MPVEAFSSASIFASISRPFALAFLRLSKSTLKPSAIKSPSRNKVFQSDFIALSKSSETSRISSILLYIFVRIVLFSVFNAAFI